MIRILIADDHPVVRAGLRAVFDAEPDFDVVGEAATPEAAVDRVRAEPGTIDVVTMDLQFGAARATGPGVLANGADATRAIRALPAAPHVLVVTNYADDSDILGAIEAGASGYLLKDAPPAELAGAVRQAASGASALAPSIQSKLLERMRRPALSLTARELEVLALVADGLSNARIAEQLFLTETTVKSHLAHIYGKLDVSSRTAAVAKARSAGLLSH